MKINKIIINNYRRIYKEQVIDLTSSNNKNINLFFGANGSGKSTIYNSIFLAFYGVEVKLEEATKKEPLINKKYSNEKAQNEICSIEISLDMEFDSKQYTVTRKINIKNNSDLELHVKQHPEHKWAFRPVCESNELFIKQIHKNSGINISDPLGFIQKEFPMELAPFYLVDGDSVNDIEEKLGVQISSAVQKYSGIKLAGEIVKHLDFMIPRIDYLETSDSEIDDLNNMLDEKTDELNKKLQAKEKAEIEFKKAKEDYDELMKGVDPGELEQLEKLKKNLQNKLINSEKEEERLSNNLKSHYQNIFNYLLVGDQVKKWIKEYDDLKKSGEVPQDITKGFLKDLLAKELCICGEPLTCDCEERLKNINDLIDKKIEVDQSEVQNMKSKITSAIDEANELNLESLKEDYININVNIEKIKSEIDEIEGQIRGLGIAIEKGKPIIDAFIKAKNNLDKILNEIKILKNEIDKLIKKIEELTGDKATNDKLKLKKDLFTIIRNSINNRVKDFENTKRNEISLKLPQQTKDAELSIDENWLIAQKYKEDQKNKGLSAGQALSSYLQYFSILLSELTTDDSRRFPIIIDSPSGKIDSKKTNATYGAVFNENENSQIIMFCTDKEWSDDLNKIWDKRLGVSFIINTDSDEYAEYEEGGWKAFQNYMS